MIDFEKYFKKQWCSGKFKNWQIFLTPAGYASTNSPIESHNNDIKSNFTAHIKFHLRPAYEIFSKLIRAESRRIREITNQGRVTTTLKQLANLIIQNKELLDIGEGIYEYKDDNIINIHYIYYSL